MLTSSNFPEWLMRALVIRFGIRQLIETGTYEGATAIQAAGILPLVHTIEISRSWYRSVAKECLQNPRIKRHQGDSVEIVPTLLPCLQGPTLWWLDGHWSGQGPKYSVECPVVEELGLIHDRQQDVVVVDDARMFEAPPGPPHDPAQWPTLEAVVQGLRGTVGRHVVRALDLLIATPTPLWEVL